jgi:multiple sugar transport system permease protein
MGFRTFPGFGRFPFLRPGALARNEQHLAYFLLAPPLVIVFALILFPVLWNLWLAFHKVRLLDLRRVGWWAQR